MSVIQYVLWYSIKTWIYLCVDPVSQTPFQWQNLLLQMYNINGQDLKYIHLILACIKATERQRIIAISKEEGA